MARNTDEAMSVEHTSLERTNNDRVNDSNKTDENFIGKYKTRYLPENLALVFNEIVEGPDDDATTPPDWLIDNLSQIIATCVNPPKRPPTCFDTTEKSLRHNLELLHSFDYDMGRFLNNR